MTGTGLQRANRYAGLVFVAVVTVILLAFVFGQAERGLAGLPAIVVYAFATGFGLECLASAWTGGWSTRGGLRSSLRRW